MRRQSLTYPLVGALLAAGAPLGLLFMRRFVLPARMPMREDLRRDLATYVYLAASTTVVFTLLGWVLGRSAERLAQLSATDGLTGLLNPRAFYPRLQSELDRSRRLGAPFSLLLLDFDQLKALNDQRGHAAGDLALQQLARVIRREMRSIDVGARLGGDEFALLAIGSSAAEARAIAGRIQDAGRGLTGQFGVPISVSIGVVAFDPSSHSVVDGPGLVRAADGALYDAKHAGRDRVAMRRLERS